jgi:hypothetical protein
MAQVAKSGTPSLCSLLPNGSDVLAGLLAGEALGAFDACYIKASDGKVYKSTGAAANAAAKVDGYASKATPIGEAVTLYKNIRVRYGTGLTPGTRLYLSATAGTLSDAATTGGTGILGFVVDDERVFLDRGNY